MTRDQQIIEAYRDGATQMVLARRFNLAQTTISKIVRKAGVSRRGARLHRVPADPDQRRTYTKLRDILGAEAARREMGL